MTFEEALHSCLSSPETPSVHESIAAAFHREYEERALGYGYETRKASRVPWDEVPEANRALMEAVVASLCRQGVIDPGPNVLGASQQ